MYDDQMTQCTSDWSCISLSDWVLISSLAATVASSFRLIMWRFFCSLSVWSSNNSFLLWICFDSSLILSSAFLTLSFDSFFS